MERRFSAIFISALWFTCNLLIFIPLSLRLPVLTGGTLRDASLIVFLIGCALLSAIILDFFGNILLWICSFAVAVVHIPGVLVFAKVNFLTWQRAKEFGDAMQVILVATLLLSIVLRILPQTVFEKKINNASRNKSSRIFFDAITIILIISFAAFIYRGIIAGRPIY